MEDATLGTLATACSVVYKLASQITSESLFLLVPPSKQVAVCS